MNLYNSLTRKVEKFLPLNAPSVGLYTCGPTVYSYATVGNFRTYVTSDILLRALRLNGFEVSFVMNLTDVGHLTGDNEGDADQGEDRLEKSAKKEGKTAWEIAKYYSDVFLKDFEKLNLTDPKIFAKATDHISEQIELIKKLESNGLVYKISDGLYFDTVTYENKSHKKYGELSSLDKILEGARVEPNLEKQNPRDFALWKFSKKRGERHMEWESPWGLGFPGWHIECSAMSMKYLGETFDIHTGGEDLRSTHHPNEIAQSEGATGKLFVKYWLHSAFLKVDGKRMGKSLGNAYTILDIEKKDFEPLALRYFYLTGHYRNPLNFTWEALAASQSALKNLRKIFHSLQNNERSVLSPEKLQKVNDYRAEFLKNINDDLNTPRALAVVWEVAKSNISEVDKRELLLYFDELLGLKLAHKETDTPVPKEVTEIFNKRLKARERGDFLESDNLRSVLTQKGYTVLDTPKGSELSKN